MTPGVKAPLHLSPSPALGAVSEGAISFRIEGEEIHHLRTGDAFYEPANVRVSKFNNDGDMPAKFFVIYLLGGDQKETIRILREWACLSVASRAVKVKIYIVHCYVGAKYYITPIL